MKECLRCQNMVTDEYHRVNCNNHEELWSCPKCTPDGEVLHSEDESSHSTRYEENLEEIKRGGDVPNKHDNGGRRKL